MKQKLTRREMFAKTGVAGAGLAAGVTAGARPAQGAADEPTAGGGVRFRYCLNTSTIRGQKLPLKETVELVAKAGYDGIEPWIGEIAAYADAGGDLADLKKRIADLGLTVESAIGFANWIVDDEQRRKKGLEDARRDMGLVRAIGGKRIAAPPAGAHGHEGLDLFAAARRYRALLDLGREMGVVPQLESWGSSKSLSRLGEVMLVAVESGHPDACILPDVYHLYKGGSEFAGLRLIDGRAIHVFHMNDYPADPPRSEIGDADRVYPGDGVAPLGSIVRDLQYIGFRGALSLELFNREYYKQDAQTVARTGLARMRAAVQKSLSQS